MVLLLFSFIFLVQSGLGSVLKRVEGDMILNQDQIDWLKTGLLNGELDGLTVNKNTEEDCVPLYQDYNAARDPTRLWPNNKVFYSFDGTLTHSEENEFRSTLSTLQEKLSSCLTFQEKDDGNRVIVGDSGYSGPGKLIQDGCWSEIGYNLTNPIYLNLADVLNPDQTLNYTCKTHGVIQHEFLHAIGIYHTQSRSDRDDYVDIIGDNIKTGQEHNFNKYCEEVISHHGLPYDFGSVMHYPEWGFAKEKGQITIKTKDPTKQDVIGQRDGVSSGDIELVRRAYGCNEDDFIYG